MITFEEFIQAATHQLSKVSTSATLEAEILLAYVLKKNRSFCRAWPEKKLTEQQWEQLNHFINRRLQYEPMAYLLGSKEFWSLDLKVSTDTLIPRPETELLVETTLSFIDNQQQNITIADLGTGSGAIALALARERPNWKIIATDINTKTLQIAAHNACRLQVNNVEFYQGDWCRALPNEKFDLIISNPPYLSEAEWPIYAEALQYEPREALVSGNDGLAAIRAIIDSAVFYLKPGGSLLLEHGYWQGPVVRELFMIKSYDNICSLADHSEQERVTTGRRSNNDAPLSRA